jgi:hypothetical protein
MSTQDPALAYAFWTSPDGSRKIVYSLSVFQDIDGTVNEGYRRIPHGGVESGGLLFGIREQNVLKIQAYRPINCQHAFGPSFLLSDGDLQGIREQLSSFREDPELAPMEALGWFIGHTRSPLKMSERELAWFEQLFPAHGAITILVKPERFQPTQFAFIFRSDSGRIVEDGSSNPVILPLSASAASGRTPSPSIPAPARSPVNPSIQRPASSRQVEEYEPNRSPSARRDPEPSDSRAFSPGPDRETQVSRQPASGQTAAKVEPVKTRRHSEQSAYDAPVPVVPQNGPYQVAPLPDRRSNTTRDKNSFGLQSAAILLLAAILGCVAGYWAYLQLPSPVIPVSIREQGTQLVVEWPAALTENVDYAAMQVNEGQWTPLTNEQKASGHSVISVPPGDVKIDLLAKHWLRDSRGIVRYVRR